MISFRESIAISTGSLKTSGQLNNSWPTFFLCQFGYISWILTQRSPKDFCSESGHLVEPVDFADDFGSGHSHARQKRIPEYHMSTNVHSTFDTIDLIRTLLKSDFQILLLFQPFSRLFAVNWQNCSLRQGGTPCESLILHFGIIWRGTEKKTVARV